MTGGNAPHLRKIVKMSNSTAHILLYYSGASIPIFRIRHQPLFLSLSEVYAGLLMKKESCFIY